MVIASDDNGQDSSGSGDSGSSEDGSAGGIFKNILYLCLFFFFGQIYEVNLEVGGFWLQKRSRYLEFWG